MFKEANTAQELVKNNANINFFPRLSRGFLLSHNNSDEMRIAETSQEGNSFSIAVIPHTWENTALIHLKTGERVNLEADLMAKYVENLLKSMNQNSMEKKFQDVSLEWLKDNGFT